MPTLRTVIDVLIFFFFVFPFPFVTDYLLVKEKKENKL